MPGVGRRARDGRELAAPGWLLLDLLNLGLVKNIDGVDDLP
jgi:hypothetical protein